MLHQLHQTYLLLGGPEPPRTHAARGRWVTRRRRLRGLLRAPVWRLPMGVHHA